MHSSTSHHALFQERRLTIFHGHLAAISHTAFFVAALTFNDATGLITTGVAHLHTTGFSR